MPARLAAVVVCVLLAGAAAAFALTRGGGGLKGASRAGAIVWAVGDGGNGSEAARKVADLIAGSPRATRASPGAPREVSPETPPSAPRG